MGYYNSGALAGTTTAYFSFIETALLAAGWTIHDTIGTRNVVYRSPDLPGFAGIYFFLHMRDVGSLGIATMIDYDASTNTDILPSGNVGSGGLAVPASTAYVYANGLGLFFAEIDGIFNNSFFLGQPRVRSLENQTDGCALTTGTITAGATSISVDRDLTGRLYVGQKIAIQNFAHNSASANASNIELVTVTSVSAGSIGVSATAFDYDSGAKIGPPDMLWPVGPTLSNGFQSYSSGAWLGSVQCVSMGMLAPPTHVQNTVDIYPGALTSVSGMQSAFYAASTQGLVPETFVPLISSPVSGDPALALPCYGFVFACVPVSGGSPAVGTKYTDGVNVFVQPSAANNPSGGPIMLVGPTGDSPDFNTQIRISPPVITVSDTLYTFVPAAASAPSNTFNQGLN